VVCTSFINTTSQPAGRHLASPFTAWLRIPFSWFHSTTFSFFPDETHRSIRRTFVSPYDSATNRQFCGYCGTQLSQWRDDDDAGDDSIQVTLGSIFEEDLEKLEEEGRLRLDSDDDEDKDEGAMEEVTGRFKPLVSTRHRGAPWYENLVRDTPLGRVKRQKGGHTSGDGTVEVEWEIVEWTEGSDEEAGEVITPGKRKIGEVEESEDHEMKT
jgi:hypothetical protein